MRERAVPAIDSVSSVQLSDCEGWVCPGLAACKGADLGATGHFGMDSLSSQDNGVPPGVTLTLPFLSARLPETDPLSLSLTGLRALNPS